MTPRHTATPRRESATGPRIFQQLAGWLDTPRKLADHSAHFKPKHSAGATPSLLVWLALSPTYISAGGAHDGSHPETPSDDRRAVLLDQ